MGFGEDTYIRLGLKNGEVLLVLACYCSQGHRHSKETDARVEALKDEATGDTEADASDFDDADLLKLKDLKSITLQYI